MPHVPSIALVSDASNIAQKDVGNSLGQLPFVGLQQGLLFWLFERGFGVSLGAAGWYLDTSPQFGIHINPLKEAKGPYQEILLTISHSRILPICSHNIWRLWPYHISASQELFEGNLGLS